MTKNHPTWQSVKEQHNSITQQFEKLILLEQEIHANELSTQNSNGRHKIVAQQNAQDLQELYKERNTHHKLLTKIESRIKRRNKLFNKISNYFFNDIAKYTKKLSQYASELQKTITTAEQIIQSKPQAIESKTKAAIRLNENAVRTPRKQRFTEDSIARAEKTHVSPHIVANSMIINSSLVLDEATKKFLTSRISSHRRLANAKEELACLLEDAMLKNPEEEANPLQRLVKHNAALRDLSYEISPHPAAMNIRLPNGQLKPILKKGATKY